MENNKRAKKLITKYFSDKVTNEERNLVNNWYLKFNAGDSLSEEELQKEHDLGLIALNQFLNKRRKLIWIRVAAAAVLTILATSFFFYNGRNKGIKETITLAQDIPPGKHVAILTLSSGDVLQLDEKQKGVTINQRAIAYEDGTPVSSTLQNEPHFNPILIAQTPRGGTYNLTLSDGTLVILNAESSLKFPQVFNGTNRVVELTGEAYFEVAKNKKMPFIVKSTDQSVEVLGTRFNVNAYPGKTPLTTLQEGSVKINAAGKEKLLTPG
ncbi:MAG: FecR domain-containing protein, partial [Pedobacter sp.]|nr:FecR domain-containing protein [Pedobacter sp.]